MDFGYKKPVFPLKILLKVGFGRVFRVSDVIIRTGSRLVVICEKNIDGRGICNEPRLALYIP
jgi:hypothetical protein